MRYPFWRVGVFVAACVAPILWLYQAWTCDLGPDPGKILVDRLGLGTLILLLITLAMTPLQRLSGWAGWIAVRRQLGLWCFAYVVMHLSAYAVFILGLDWAQLGVELIKRPYIIVGSLAFVCLLALAVTSNQRAALGRSLNQLVKLSATGDTPLPDELAALLQETLLLTRQASQAIDALVKLT